MKKFVLAGIVAAASLISFAARAQSEATGCHMSFNVDINSVVLVSFGDGFGHVVCQGEDGRWSDSPVSIKVDGLGLGLGKFRLVGLTGTIGIKDPRDLYGDYAVIDATVGAIGAARATLGFEGTRTGLAFSGSLSGGVGLGASLMGTTWRIRPLGPPPVPVYRPAPRSANPPCPQPTEQFNGDEEIGDIDGPAGE